VSASTKVDPDALLCALILAPRTFPRNRYFALYEDAVARRVRRRASRVRGIIRQLVASGREQAEITGEQVLADGRMLIRYHVEGLALHRTIALSQLEAAALHYALHRAGIGILAAEDRRLVERALERLGADLEAPSAAPPSRKPHA
jgi:HAMP domain-containing protein